MRWHQVDVRDAGALADALRGADAVVHLAWAIQPSRDRATTRSINVDGSRSVFAATAASGARALVHASSVRAYGPADDDEPVDEAFPAAGLPTSFWTQPDGPQAAAADRWKIRPGLLDDVDTGGSGDPPSLRRSVPALGAATTGFRAGHAPRGRYPLPDPPRG